MSTKILVAADEAATYSSALSIFGTKIDVVTCRDDASEAGPLLADAEVLVTIGRWLTPHLVLQAGKLRWVQCIISGTDHLTGLFGKPQVMVTNCRGIQGTQMAELAVLHMMTHLRQVPRLVRNRDAHVWDRFGPRVLERKRVGILGVGRIASQLAHVCKAFQMVTVGITRTLRSLPEFDELRLRDDLERAVSDLDFLVVLLPLSTETQGIVSSSVLSSMKKDSYLINIGRGGTVDEEALLQVLREGSIAGAGLDVFRQAPLPPGHPFWAMGNVFITPFIGGHSDLYASKAAPIVQRNVAAYLEGRIDDMDHVETQSNTAKP